MRKHRFARSQLLLSVFVIMAVLSGCIFSTDKLQTPSQTPTISSVEPTNDSGSGTGAIQIFFTDPTAPRARDYRGGPDQLLADAIDNARLSVDMAAYSLNLWSIRDALIRADKRGVVVRMVMESDNMDSREVQQIKDAGIPVIGDQHEGLMHNKFVVLDRSEVWTGSMNFTTGGAYKDNNNLIRIKSIQVAEDYTVEFEEMFIKHLFGQDVIAKTPYPELSVDGTQVEIYFSPDDKVAARIIELIQGAQQNIFFMAYNFTSNDIGDSIMQAAQTGINVAGVMDADQVVSSQGTEYDAFMQAGMNVRLDGNEAGLMHHKVIIIDQEIVIAGSYNFTASAEDSNDENVVIFFSREIAQQFMHEFQRVHDLAQPISSGTASEATSEATIEPTIEATSEIP